MWGVLGAARPFQPMRHLMAPSSPELWFLAEPDSDLVKAIDGSATATYQGDPSVVRLPVTQADRDAFAFIDPDTFDQIELSAELRQRIRIGAGARCKHRAHLVDAGGKSRLIAPALEQVAPEMARKVKWLSFEDKSPPTLFSRIAVILQRPTIKPGPIRSGSKLVHTFW